MCVRACCDLCAPMRLQTRLSFSAAHSLAQNAPRCIVHRVDLGIVHPDNPRYFTDGSGKAIYMTGSHTWSNLIDEDNNYPPDQWFDFNGYLDFMEDRNHNFIRMWTWELFKYWTRYVEPNIWQRTGPGNALDGNPKFDLTKFNQDYFNRMRSRVIAAGDREIYVSIMLFEGYGLQFAEWDGHPFNINNNIQ